MLINLELGPMKFSDILVAILVLAIIGTIGVGVYFFFFTDAGTPQTEDEITIEDIASPNKLSFIGQSCKISLSYPSNWKVTEAAISESPSVEVALEDYKVVVICNAEPPEHPGEYTFKTDDILVDGTTYSRYVFFTDQNAKLPKIGYVWPKDTKDLTEEELESGKGRVVTIGDSDYTMGYEFSASAENLSKKGKESFAKYLEVMDAITTSIKFKSQEES